MHRVGQNTIIIKEASATVNEIGCNLKKTKGLFVINCGRHIEEFLKATGVPSVKGVRVENDMVGHKFLIFDESVFGVDKNFSYQFVNYTVDNEEGFISEPNKPVSFQKAQSVSKKDFSAVKKIKDKRSDIFEISADIKNQQFTIFFNNRNSTKAFYDISENKTGDLEVNFQTIHPMTFTKEKYDLVMQKLGVQGTTYDELVKNVRDTGDMVADFKENPSPKLL